MGNRVSAQFYKRTGLFETWTVASRFLWGIVGRIVSLYWHF